VHALFFLSLPFVRYGGLGFIKLACKQGARHTQVLAKVLGKLYMQGQCTVVGVSEHLS
jgi:hypothetical protein